jgi:hypothetical protein
MEECKSHNEELYDLYSMLNILEVMKSKRMRYANHVACGREEKCV